MSSGGSSEPPDLLRFSCSAAGILGNEMKYELGVFHAGHLLCLLLSPLGDSQRLRRLVSVERSVVPRALRSAVGGRRVAAGNTRHGATRP